MITVHHEKETDFSKNGYGSIDDYIINPSVHWEMNGEFRVDFDYPIFLGEKSEYLQNRNILRVPVPFMQDQLFRIYRTRKVLGFIEVEARHIFYDLLDNLIEDTFVVGKNGLGAVQQMLDNTQYPHRFQGLSDISITTNARMVRLNPVEALLDDSRQNSFVSRWGGEILRDNFRINMRRQMGANRGIHIEHKKDLTGYEATIDDSTIVTRIYPRGFDGLELPERYIDSPKLDPEHPKIKIIDYDVKAAIGDYANDEDAVPLEEAYALLRQYARNEYSTHHIDEPETVIHVDFVTLNNTQEYGDLAHLQEIHQGDIVKVSVPDEGFEVTSRLVGFTSDPLQKDHYTSTTLGNHVLEFTSGGDSIESIRREINTVNEEIIRIRQTADGKANTFDVYDDPNNLELNAHLGDIAFQVNGDEMILWIYVEVNGERVWKVLANTAELDMNRRDLEKIIEDAEQDRKNTQQAIEQTLSDAKHYTEQKSEEFRIEFNSQLDEVRDIAVTAPDQIAEAIQRAGFGSSLGDLTDRVIELSNQAGETASQAYAEAIRASSATGHLDTKITGVEQKVDEVEGSIRNRIWQADIANSISTMQTEFNQTFESFEQSIVRVESDLNGKVSTTDFNILQSDVDRTINRIGNAEGRLNTVESTANGTQQTVTRINSDLSTVSTRVTSLANGLNVLSREQASKNLVTDPNFDRWTNVSDFWLIDNMELRGSQTPGSLVFTNVTNGHLYQPASQWTLTSGVKYEVTITYNGNGNLRVGQGGGMEGVDVPRNGTATQTQTVIYEATSNLVLRIKCTGGGDFRIRELRVRETAAVSEAQLSVLSNEIDMAVSRGDVIGRINIQAGRTLLQNNTLVMSANTTVFTGSAFIPDASIIELRADKVYGTEAQFATIRSRVLITNAVTATHIQSSNALIDKIFASSALINRLTSMQAFINSIRAIDISADRITTGTLNAAIVRSINLDVSQISGNLTNFVQSYWNSVSSQVEIVGEGVRSTASDGSQALVQNGVFLSRNNSGSTVGYLGYSQLSGSPWYRLQITLGANFEIRGIVSGGSNRQMMSFYPQSNEIYMHPSNLYMVGRINAQSGITSSGTLHMGGNTITQVSQINLLHGGYLNSLSSNSELRLRSSGGRMQIGTSGSWAIVIDNTHVYMHRTLNMQNNQITQQSDMRLKSNIVIDEINSLEAIRAWSFAGFNWKNDSEKGRQFGLLAQGANEIAFKGADGFLNVDSTKQLNMTSHAVQQLDKKVVNIKDYLDKQFEQIAFDNLQRDLEIKRLKERVAQLEKGAS